MKNKRAHLKGVTDTSKAEKRGEEETTWFM